MSPIRHSARFALLLSAASMLAGAAQAQDGDVVVMRRTISPPTRIADPNTMRPVDGADTNSYYWEVSGWFATAEACSAKASETRLRGCVLKGKQVDEALCPQPAPDVERFVEKYSGCGFAWTTTGAGEWASSCSSKTTRPVTAQCRRDDGTVFPDTSCAAQTKPGSESGSNYAGCTYKWTIGDYGAWDSQCSEATSRTRPVQCVRSNGDGVGDAACLAAGDRPIAVESGANLAGCSYAWKPGAWSQPDSTCSEQAGETRTSTCVRSDQKTVDASLCTTAEPPRTQTVQSLSGCGYAWKAGDYGDWSSTCSASSTRTRAVSCLRTDGVQADQAGRCTDAKPATSETADVATSCTYSWKAGDWSAVPACSATSSHSRVVTCTRSDGTATSDDTKCVAADKPSTSEPVADYSRCSFDWKTTAYSAWSSTCSATATRTRTAYCQRSDGTPADTGCDAAQKPAESDQTAVYTGCGTYWTSGAWGAWSATCSAGASRTRSATCMQKQPGGDVAVDPLICDQGTKPSTSESGNYASCTNAWVAGTWGWNGTSGATSSACDTQAQQTMTPTCQATLTTGAKVTVADSYCTAAKPATTRTTSNVTSCTYRYDVGQWSPYSSTCSSAATHTRTVACIQSDPLGTTVADTTCYNKGLGYAPARTETISNVTDCTGLLQNGGFESGAASPWVLTGSTASISTSGVHSGTKSLHLSTASTYATQTIPTVVGKRYSASMWVYGFSGQTANMKVNGVAVIPNVNGGGNTNMAQGGGYFTATSTSTTIVVNGYSQWTFGDIYVDDVVVSPEP